jgi:hypothetical protein
LIKNPTPYPEVNTLLDELFASVQPILQGHFIGMYLDGSLASGGFDQDSDIDFVVVTDVDVSGDLFYALQAMHDRIAKMDSIWAIQLEGSYISLHAIRRYDPAHALHPNLERGEGERLKMAEHDQTWNVHRYVLRKRGITLAGPTPQTFIDPVGPAQLEQAMLINLSGWAAHLLDNPSAMQFRGYQSYIVLSLCRILYTLQNDEVVSKARAADWAQKTQGEGWVPLIDSAWEGRHDGGESSSPEDVDGTLALIRYALKYGERFRLKRDRVFSEKPDL